MSYAEHSSLFKSTTGDPLGDLTEADEKTFIGDLGTDIGAPFELYIKHTGAVGSTGILKYTDGEGAPVANNRISTAESREIGNNIHRILKYYLSSDYNVIHISHVRLNVVFKE
jgi:hypothetical protein